MEMNSSTPSNLGENPFAEKTEMSFERAPRPARRSTRISEYREHARLAQMMLTADHHLNVYILSKLTAAQVCQAAQVHLTMRRFTT